MKAGKGCGELRQGYCSFPLHLLSKGASDLMRGEDVRRALMTAPFVSFGGANEDVPDAT